MEEATLTRARSPRVNKVEESAKKVRESRRGIIRERSRRDKRRADKLCSGVKGASLDCPLECLEQLNVIHVNLNWVQNARLDHLFRAGRRTYQYSINATLSLLMASILN